MRKVEALGLARPLGPTQWSLSENAEDVLRELGERDDIIKRIHRGLTEKGWERGASDFVLHGEGEPAPVIGLLVARGLDDELTGSAYVVIDGVDGRAHHIRLPYLDAAGVRRRARSSNCAGSRMPLDGPNSRSPFDRIFAIENSSGGAWRDLA